jgi:phospholipid/cholesterol/gamma-HCH transport system substrate-binding protein
MRIPHAALPAIRAVVVLLFAVLCATIFGFLWLNAGGKLPFLSKDGYQVKIKLPDVDNLVYQSDVRMAGVDVGKVEDVQDQGSDAMVTVALNEKNVAPLHQGATLTVRNKTMIEETYLEIKDGKGPEIPNGQTLPSTAGKPSVQLDDVLTSLDGPTRKSLGQTLQSAEQATGGRRQDVGRTLRGLGDLGREGGDALDALAEQSKSLKAVTGNTTALLGALDTGQGRVAELVRDSDALTKTVSANKGDVETLMRKLPATLDTTRTASTHLGRLAGSLAPVSRNLAAAGPDLTSAMRELPATTNDLRGLLPSLNRTLDAAPETLHKVPAFGTQLRPMLGALHADLGDVNPMLSYLRPYGRDAAALFANFSQYLSGSDPNGNIGRVLPVFNEKSPNLPLNTHIGPLYKRNPYPAPGASADPMGRPDAGGEGPPR